MYSSLTPIKLCTILVILVIIPLQGYATEHIGGYPSETIPVEIPSPIKPQPLNTNQRSFKKPIISHIVRRGESISLIAQRYGYTVKQLARWNGLEPPYSIYAGRRLRVAPLSIRYKKGKKPPKKTVSHVIQRGESISMIAQRYGYTVQQLARWNGLVSPYILYAGRRLRVAPLPWSKNKRRSKKIRPAKKPNKKSIKQPKKTVSHVVQRGESISMIAQRYGYTVQQLARWNGLESPYILYAGRRMRVAPLQWSKNKRRSKKSTKQPKKTVSHVVQRGENISMIARRYGYTTNQLASWNNLKSPYILLLGQRLRLFPQRTNKLRAKRHNKPANVQSRIRHNSGYHTVVSGETLYSISRSYGYSVSKVARWNNLSPPYNLFKGQRLRVYPPTGSRLGRNKKSTRQTSRQTRNYHTVVLNDTLYSIAKRYGKTVSQVAQWNKLGAPYSLSVGQRLLVSFSKKSKKRRTVSRHIVKKGESLRAIAAKYGIKAYKLADWNGIGNPYTIYPGQRLSLIPPK